MTTKTLRALIFAIAMLGLCEPAAAEYAEVTVKASAAETASGSSAVVNTMPVLAGRLGPGCRAVLVVSAVSGTSPTLDAELEVSVAGTNVVVASFAQFTATGSASIAISECPPNLRAAWAITGTTPSFTFKVLVLRQN